MKTNIWVSYHNNDLYNIYKLDELDKNIYIPYDVTSFSEPELHKYFSEFTTMYYVYKNNIKSDIIGFCHYRRYFDLSTINFEDIYNNNEIYVINEKYIFGLNLDHKNKRWPMCPHTYSNIIYNTYLNFLEENNVPLKNPYKYYENNFFFVPQCGLYLLRYDTFLYLSNIIFNYFNEIICTNFMNNYDVIYSQKNPNKRICAYVFEQLFGFLMYNNNYNNCIVKPNIINHTYVYELKTGNKNEIEHIKKMYFAYLKTGFKEFYVIKNGINVQDWFNLDIEYFFYYIKIINSFNEITSNKYEILS